MTERSGAGLSLVHIDDDPMQGDVMRFVFGQRGYEVVSFDDPKEALDEILLRLKKNPSGMVLVTDGNMPGMNGGELATRIRTEQNGDGVPIVLVTGSMQMFTDRYPNVFDAIVPKPYHLRDLIQGVGSAQEIAAKRQEVFLS